MWRENQWKPEEWNEFREKLEMLSLDEVKELVTRVGIKFTGGVEVVKDKSGISAKEQLILVLDEADKKQLIMEYKKLMSQRK